MQEAVELNIYTGDNNEFMLILSSCKNASVAEKIDAIEIELHASS